ncbi:MAG: hypothetical protein ACE5HS_00505 [bacterium]
MIQPFQLNRLFKVRHSKFVFISILYLISGGLLVPFYRYQISPDSTSYISIAQKYLSGDFYHAVNGIWAPLYSWLLMPWIVFGMEPLLASVILTVIFGWLILVSVHRLLKNFEFSADIHYLILIALIPVILSFAFSDSPADFFVIFFLILYFDQILDKKFASSKTNGLLCGVFGSLAYFSKAFALPFFLAHFTLCCLIYFIKAKQITLRKNILRHLLMGLFTCFVISGVWIAIISVKYHHFTISTAGRFNYLAAGPESKSKGGPFYYEGLFPPSNETATSGWEDPTYHEIPVWSPFASRHEFKHQVQLLLKNVKKTLAIFNSFSRISTFILLFWVVVAIIPLGQKFNKDAIWFALISMIVYCAGYVLMVVEARYLWINCILLLLMAGYLLNLLFKRWQLKQYQKYILIVFIMGTFMYPASKYLIRNIDTKKQVYLLSQKLKNEFQVHGNLAANKHHSSLYLAYHLRAKYFGRVRENISDRELEVELSKYEIDYFLVWGGADYHVDFFRQFEEVTNHSIRGLKIYSLKKNKKS